MNSDTAEASVAGNIFSLLREGILGVKKNHGNEIIPNSCMKPQPKCCPVPMSPFLVSILHLMQLQVLLVGVKGKDGWGHVLCLQPPAAVLMGRTSLISRSVREGGRCESSFCGSF